MRNLHLQRVRGFTMVELLVVVGSCFVILALLPALLPCSHTGSARISCVNRLKQIGLAARVWAGDNGDLYPAQVSSAAGGWKDYVTNSNAGVYCYTYYTNLHSELGDVPRIVVCPADDRQPATNFAKGFGNTNISYFLGVEGNDTTPSAIMGGDRNLGPGPKPDPNYGYSPLSGKGNDVVISTKSAVSPLVWSLKLHSQGNTKGMGNILMGDGSVQQVSDKQIGPIQATASTNATFRLVFP